MLVKYQTTHSQCLLISQCNFDLYDQGVCKYIIHGPVVLLAPYIKLNLLYEKLEWFSHDRIRMTVFVTLLTVDYIS